MIDKGQPNARLGRLGGAVLLAPPLGGAIGFAFAAAIAHITGDVGNSSWTLSSVYGSALAAGAFGLVGGIVGGTLLMTVLWMPTHLALYRLGQRSIAAYLLVGGLFLIALYALPPLSERWRFNVYLLALLPHLCIGAIFWLIRRPTETPPRIRLHLHHE